ncbi:hypothetical protein DUNSADRAFT_360 [Dunaliella salina]|uniref:Uncharacterized protein n=1 Tax=Dunaliella salina TaxID=3046 RepID=A0ABQ7FZ21_DUNSA|nr:hypothetical protein DUNSADRAFT_360 [Dunaliella salina]|eukprot:KAF5827609.1 hypothetical protein DUNSADRAFT_360 [Dunaliella salina]
MWLADCLLILQLHMDLFSRLDVCKVMKASPLSLGTARTIGGLSGGAGLTMSYYRLPCLSVCRSQTFVIQSLTLQTMEAFQLFSVFLMLSNVLIGLPLLSTCVGWDSVQAK